LSLLSIGIWLPDVFIDRTHILAQERSSSGHLFQVTQYWSAEPLRSPHPPWEIVCARSFGRCGPQARGPTAVPSRNCENLVAELIALASRGELEVKQGDATIKDPRQLQEILAPQIAEHLGRLGRCALLVA
jgi:hypothetical protein